MRNSLENRNSPSITVAIPTYNGARHLAEALRGILIQEKVAFDLLISDDRSEDETLEIARSLAGDRVQIQVNSERLGLAGNWNHCVALTQTPLVAIFHQDDRMEPGHLVAHLEAFQTHPEAGLVGSEALVIDESGHDVPDTVVERSRIAPADHLFKPGEFLSELLVRNPLRCSAVTLRKQAHEAVGGFDPSYKYVVDWDFWARVATDWAVVWLAHPTVAMRWHLASETHRFKIGTQDLEEIERIQSLLMERFESRGDRIHLEKAARRRLARAYLNRTHDCLHRGEAGIARACLDRAVALDRGIWKTIALDPKLALSLAALVAAPAWTSRWYLRHHATHLESE